MRNNDEWTLSLMTNPEIIGVNQYYHGGKQLYRDENTVIWSAVSQNGNPIVAVFNISNEKMTVSADLEKYGISGKFSLRDLWARQDIGTVNGELICDVNSHGARIFELRQV